MTPTAYIVSGLLLLVAVLAVIELIANGKLKKENKSYRNIFRHTNDTLLLIDIADGKIKYANISASELLGYPRDTLVTKTIFDLHEKSQLARSAEIIATVYEKKGLIYSDLPFISATGEKIDVECSAKVEEFGGKPVIFISARDIRERLWMEGEIKKQSAIIAEKNKDLIDSINCASRIQRALLTTDDYLSKYLKEYFILFKPRDIVSGDFYWAYAAPLGGGGAFHIACCDCTGHGVPGAFMSLLNISMFNETVIERKITRPDLALNDIRNNIIKALNPEGSDIESKDGMDCIYCSFDMEHKMLYAACANNPLWIIKQNDRKTVIEFTPDKMPVGVHYGIEKPFTLHSEQLAEGDCIYLFSDGYADQFGGPKGKKFKHSQLQEKLLEICDKPLAEQRNILEKTFEGWKGNNEQVDDVLVIGIKI
ncbi:MAG: SpoIIE family protein phosphatase [Bacteroidia bacterium]